MLNRPQQSTVMKCVPLSGFLLYCAAATTQTDGRVPIDVLLRRSFVYRPSSAPSSGAAAVLVLHGSGGVAEDMFHVGMEPLAQEHGFLVVYPEMVRQRADEWQYKNDVPYFAALVNRLTDHDFGVDPARIFICGHSAGGSMVYFLQNEMNAFAAAGVVEAAVGNLDLWNMTKRGNPTIVVWNHADPVLTEYAPHHSEPEYYNLTVNTLRRGGSKVPTTSKQLPLSKTVTQAQLLLFEEEASAPEVQMLSWTSSPGQHTWASKTWTGTIDASEQLVKFFLGVGTKQTSALLVV
eukprot:TRINITY_DN9690_c0_g2_i1.p1 TRINITY_DN9690_c0_g2~~TRINITY_DN9690_c0_g2_i1.p1  ORF type:complete len:292 (+),score=41.96 TRINITY_DN9690_c0_g2_i1:541-1416(+)